MALSQTVVFKGITIPDAYVRIKSFTGTKDVTRCEVHIHSQKPSPDPMKEGDTLLIPAVFEMPTDLASADNPIKQGYAFLKTLPEYKAAKDV